MLHALPKAPPIEEVHQIEMTMSVTSTNHQTNQAHAQSDKANTKRRVPNHGFVRLENSACGSVKKYRFRWVLEYQDEWLAFESVPKDLMELFEARNVNKKEKRNKRKRNLHLPSRLPELLRCFSKMRYKSRIISFTPMNFLSCNDQNHFIH
jgi:hypothetical protein